MKVAHVRLLFAAVLFLAWIGWLVYLVVHTRNPVILSRPQFLAADLWVIVDIPGSKEEPASTADVVEVVWPGDMKQPIGKKLDIPDLPKREDQGWTEPGEYIVPLTVHETPKRNLYTVTRLPASPGYPGGDKRIYRATPDARAQLRELVTRWKS